jgi:hypothetical protein
MDVYLARYNGGIAVHTDRKAAQDHCVKQVETNRDRHPAGHLRWMEHPPGRGSIDNLFIDPTPIPGEEVAHHTGAEVWRVPVHEAGRLAVVFDRPDPDSVYAWGPFTDRDLARRFCEFVTAEIDPAKVLPWEDATALAGPRVLDPMRELLAWRENVALPQITEADETRTELAVVKGQLRAAQQEAYDAETRAAQLRDALNDATATN